MVKHPEIHSTTVLAIRRGDVLAIAADGQVTMNNTVVKSGAKKIRTLASGKVLCGFAGSAADAFALFSRLETRLEEQRGNLLKAAVEMARDWRTDKYLRQLQALLVAGSKEHLLILSGTGDVIEPDDGLAAIGSGGSFALAAARALVAHTQLSAVEIAQQSLEIAADLCVFTNRHISIETLPLT